MWNPSVRQLLPPLFDGSSWENKAPEGPVPWLRPYFAFFLCKLVKPSSSPWPILDQAQGAHHAARSRAGGTVIWIALLPLALCVHKVRISCWLHFMHSEFSFFLWLSSSPQGREEHSGGKWRAGNEVPKCWGFCCSESEAAAACGGGKPWLPCVLPANSSPSLYAFTFIASIGWQLCIVVL